MSRNNQVVGTLSSSDFIFPSIQFGAVAFDTFTNDTYNVDLATQNKSNYDAELLRALTYLGGTTSVLASNETIQSVTANIIRYFHKVYANKFGRIKFTSTITIDDTSYTVVDNELVLTSVLSSVYPEYDLESYINPYLTQFQSEFQVDSMNGTIGFLTEQNKYDNIEIDITNAYFYNDGINTHDEIEDAFELVNYGLTSRLARTSAIGLLKQGMFIEKTFGKAHTVPIDDCEYALPFQANYIISDNQSWYDTLNSTVDYSEEVSSEDVNVSISYPIAVKNIDAAGKVYVGGLEGLISIDVSTDDVVAVDFNGGKLSEEVTDIFVTGSNIYIVSPKNVYLSTDNGGTWDSVFTGGATGEFNKISKIKII